MIPIIIGVKYDEHHENVNPRVAERLAVKVSREKMAGNRLRILSEASRLFREKGFEAVSVAEVMKAAGLTHGGFYGHFKSKDDLIAQTLAHATPGEPAEAIGFDAFLKGYLSPRHRDDAAAGCPTAALASDTRHQTDEARAAMTANVESQLARIAGALPDPLDGGRRRAAIGTWSAMVGAMILARSLDDAALSDEILDETRAWIAANLAQANRS